MFEICSRQVLYVADRSGSFGRQRELSDGLSFSFRIQTLDFARSPCRTCYDFSELWSDIDVMMNGSVCFALQTHCALLDCPQENTPVSTFVTRNKVAVVIRFVFLQSLLLEFIGLFNDDFNKNGYENAHSR